MALDPAPSESEVIFKGCCWMFPLSLTLSLSLPCFAHLSYNPVHPKNIKHIIYIKLTFSCAQKLCWSIHTSPCPSLQTLVRTARSWSSSRLCRPIQPCSRPKQGERTHLLHTLTWLRAVSKKAETLKGKRPAKRLQCLPISSFSRPYISYSLVHNHSLEHTNVTKYSSSCYWKLWLALLSKLLTEVAAPRLPASFASFMRFLFSHNATVTLSRTRLCTSHSLSTDLAQSKP